MPLLPDELHDEYSRELLESILEYSGRYDPFLPSVVSLPKIEDCLRQLWELFGGCLPTISIVRALSKLLPSAPHQ